MSVFELNPGPAPVTGPVQLDAAEAADLQRLGEAHYWPHAKRAGDLSPTSGIRIATGGEGVWVYDADRRPFLDTISGMWLANIGHGR